MTNKIRELRDRKGMSQEELADKAGISRTTLSYLESGKTIVTKTDTLQKIAKALEMSVSDVFFTD